MNRLINMPCFSTLVTGMGWAKTLKLQQYSMITACTWQTPASGKFTHSQKSIISSSQIYTYTSQLSASDSAIVRGYAFTDEGDYAVLRSDHSFITTPPLLCFIYWLFYNFHFSLDKRAYLIHDFHLIFNSFHNKTSWERLNDTCYRAIMSTTTTRPIKVLKIAICIESHTMNLNNWLGNTTLFYKSMWIWDQRTIRSAKITIQWAINSGWTHSVTAKPLLFHIGEGSSILPNIVSWEKQNLLDSHTCG